MKNIYTYILILSGVILFPSCGDFFELKRPQETQWTTTSTFEQGLSTCYWNLHWGTNGKGYLQYVDFATSGTARMHEGVSIGVPYNQLYNRSFGDQLGQSRDIWVQGYEIVTLCNLALTLDEEGKGNPFNLIVSEDDYKHNYVRQVGEYYFLRAKAYLNLIKYFAKPYDQNGSNNELSIPLKTKAAASKEDVFNEKLGTIEEVYAQIISDLKRAKEILPYKFTKTTWSEVSGYESGRANKSVAAAILGKVYFSMGDYVGAQKEFDFVINHAEQSGEYRLGNPDEPFINAKASEVAKETIWEFNSGQLDGQSDRHNSYMYFGMIYGLRFRDSQGQDFTNVPENNSGITMSGWNAFAIGHWALKEMDWMTDPLNGDYTITQKAKDDLRYQQVYHLMLPFQAGIKKGDPAYVTTESVASHAQVNTPNVYIDKFFRGQKPYGKFGKFPLIRLAELYLLRSWIRWNNADLQGTADDLNKVWNRSNPHNMDVYSSANVNHNAIFREFLREMTGEGGTVDFMMGTGMTIPTGDNKLIQPENKPYAKWHWPIPDVETSLNPNYK